MTSTANANANANATATATATVSEKGQVTLPKQLRTQLGIVPGTRLDFQIGKDGSLLVRVLSTGAAGLVGLLARPGEAVRSLDELDDAVTATVLARSGRPP